MILFLAVKSIWYHTDLLNPALLIHLSPGPPSMPQYVLDNCVHYSVDVWHVKLQDRLLSIIQLRTWTNKIPARPHPCVFNGASALAKQEPSSYEASSLHTLRTKAISFRLFMLFFFLTPNFSPDPTRLHFKDPNNSFLYILGFKPCWWLTHSLVRLLTYFMFSLLTLSRHLVNAY